MHASGDRGFHNSSICFEHKVTSGKIVFVLQVTGTPRRHFYWTQSRHAATAGYAYCYQHSACTCKVYTSNVVHLWEDRFRVSSPHFSPRSEPPCCAHTHIYFSLLFPHVFPWHFLFLSRPIGTTHDKQDDQLAAVVTQCLGGHFFLFMMTLFCFDGYSVSSLAQLVPHTTNRMSSWRRW
jgi:hypothetical protein